MPKLNQKPIHINLRNTCLILASSVALLAGCNKGPQQGVVATVNGKPIFQTEVDKAYDAQLAGNPQQQPPSPSQADSIKLNLLHGHSPRLLSYDGIDIEAELSGTLVVIRNLDVPGVIGRIGTILGEAKLNIASFALGRAKPSGPGQGHALAVVQLDVSNSNQPALEQALNALRQVDAITSVRTVELGKL